MILSVWIIQNCQEMLTFPVRNQTVLRESIQAFFLLEFMGKYLQIYRQTSVCREHYISAPYAGTGTGVAFAASVGSHGRNRGLSTGKLAWSLNLGGARGGVN